MIYTPEDPRHGLLKPDCLEIAAKDTNQTHFIRTGKQSVIRPSYQVATGAMREPASRYQNLYLARYWRCFWPIHNIVGPIHDKYITVCHITFAYGNARDYNSTCARELPD